MVAPAVSEPNAPRGQILAGIYAIQNSDSKGESRADPLQHHVREMNPSDSFPEGKKPTVKAKDNARNTHPPQDSVLNHHAWSRRTLAVTGILVMAIAALGAHLARQALTAAPSGTEAAPLIAAAPVPTPISIPIIAAPATEVAKLPTERETVASAAAAPPGGNSVAVRIGSLSQSPQPAAEKKRAETVVPLVPKAEVKGEDPQAQSSRVAIKRRQTRSEEELRKDLRRTPEVPSFTAEQVSRLLMTHGQNFQVSGQLDFEPRALFETRPDLQSLAVRHGRAGHVNAWTAANLQTFARKLHFLVDRVVPREKDGSHVQPVLLHEFMHQEIRGKRPSWLRPEAIPALQQILAHEDKAIRWLLVELLAEIPGPAASIALAQRAT